jgi:VWFA-related protein
VVSLTVLNVYRVLLASACVASVSVAAGAVQQQPTPQFRTGVDLTRVEITVLHKDTRKPIPGLTAEDFVIKVDGDVQRVATLAEVKVPSAREAAAPGFAEAAHDVAGNDRPSPRLFVIVMNDAAGGSDSFNRRTGIRIAHRLIDGLGPHDRAAVVFARDNRNAQDLTADRTLLRRAVDQFNPMGTVGIKPFEVLRRAQQFLSDMPGYRRALVFISPVATVSLQTFGPNLFGIDEDAEADGRELRAIATGARIGHVPIYMFSTHGLHAPTAQDIRRGGRNAGYEAHLEIFRTIADLTGGRTVAANNSPAQLVPAVFEELASYYALAYENTYPPDGRRRWLQIQVKRRDAMVMPSRVLIRATRSAGGVKADAALEPGRESGLAEALAAPLPSGDVPLRLSSVPLAVPGKREQAVALTLGLPRVPAGAKEELRVRLMLFDGEGRREILGQTHDVKVTGPDPPSEWNEMAMRMDLRPGRYQLRIAAERLSTSKAGSVHATVIIPDFAGDALSLSGVAIGRTASAPVGGREALADLLPFAPTVARMFASGDRVGALLRVHQSARRPAQPVVMETDVLDAAGAVVHSGSRTIRAEAFAEGSGVEHRVELPLATLTAGDYLLRFVAMAGEARAQRDVRFSVK